MQTQQPAAASTSSYKPSRSLSGSLCDLFSDADSGSGMKAELSTRPGVSESALGKRLSGSTQEAVWQLHWAPASILVSLYFSGTPDFYSFFFIPNSM